MKHVPQKWMHIDQAHPYEKIGWLLNDRADELPDDLFYEIVDQLEQLYQQHFISFIEEKTDSGDMGIMNEARENVYQALNKKWLKKQEKEQKTDVNAIPILQQATGNKPKAKKSVYQFDEDVETVNKMIDAEYKILLQKKQLAIKKAEAKKEPPKKPAKKSNKKPSKKS